MCEPEGEENGTVVRATMTGNDRCYSDRRLYVLSGL